jgi:asparagine synthetase B (glutamine-hydrolysing)
VEGFGQGWQPPAGGERDGNVIEWSDTQITVRTSRQNFTPVYRWTDSRRARLLVSTDLATLTARVISASETEGDLLSQVRAARVSIRKIPAHRTVRFTLGPGGGQVIEHEAVEPGWSWSNIPGETASDAGLRQIQVIERGIATAGDHGPVTALVSGGVDSGTVAALAWRAGMLDGVATLGTEWGNEHAEAEELGAHLGCPVRYILLSEDDILNALPETIRMLGEPGNETVAIASNLVAMYQRAELPPGTLLTGYGSDLLNSGLRVDGLDSDGLDSDGLGSGGSRADGSRAGGSRADRAAVENLRPAVRFQLEQASISGEFSGAAAAAHGYAVRHPFWSSGVIQAALDTDPALMHHGGREKGHLRAAASRLLPHDVAWRRKQALHRGSGVDHNLDRALARRLGTGTVGMERLYAFIDAQLVGELIKSPDRLIDGPECLDAAMYAYRTSVT